MVQEKVLFLKMINGIVSYDSGDILYKNSSIKNMDASTLRNTRKNLAYIFQHSNLIDNKTVYYHLSLVYKLNKVSVDKKKIDDILEFMNGSCWKKLASISLLAKATFSLEHYQILLLFQEYTLLL